MRCPNCGKEVPDQSTFCLHCGTSISTQERTSNTQSSIGSDSKTLKPRKSVNVLGILAALLITGVIIVAVLAMLGPSVGNVFSHIVTLPPEQLTQFAQQGGGGASSGSDLPADAQQAVLKGFRYFAQTLEGCPKGCTFSIIGAQRATLLSSGLDIPNFSNPTAADMTAAFNLGPQDEVWCVLLKSAASSGNAVVQYDFYGVAKRGLDWVAGPLSDERLGVDAGVTAFRRLSCTIAP